MSKHFRTPIAEPEEKPETVWGQEHGALDGFGYCTNPQCRLGPFGPGIYYCLVCNEGEY